MRCTQRENVQEHSLQVAVVTHALALVKNKYFSGTVIPEEFKPDYRELLNASDASQEVTGLIKAADSLCAYIKCLEELAAGNKEFSRALKTIENKIESLRMRPEVDYFVKHFIPGFSLTIDEISEPLESERQS